MMILKNKIPNDRTHRFFIPILCALLLSSCVSGGIPATPTDSNMAFVEIPKPGSTQIIASPTSAPPTGTSMPNADVIAVSVWVPPYLDETMGTALEEPLRGLFVSDETTANVKFEVGTENIVSQWIYALVTPFSSTLPGLSGDQVLSHWQGQSSAQLLVDSNTHAMLDALWGPAGTNVQVVAKHELIDYAWTHQPTLAIVPFEALDPRWKVLPVDGLSPIRKDFVLENYRLKVPISLNSDPGRAALIRENFVIPPSNVDPQKMTVVAMTGVTALVRATASTMERRGILYPAEDIRDWLLSADITHISNEVPFAEDCPEPNPVQESMRFCSKDEYIGLLEDVGTDVLELTGDHFSDWGTQAMFHTLEMYTKRSWPYYGGGANLAEGRKALLLEHNHNKIAFIVCNAKGGSFAQASDTLPGAAACDMDWMAGEIARLKAEGILVIATFQHLEYYMYAAQPDQQRDFRQMAQAGADVVSGSQAHQPQGMEFIGNSFIHYGLGNLFFDQYGLCDACRQGFIDRHIFYDGRYISTELLPIEFIDYARSRPMAIEEADELLETLFSASGWR
jgi:poly-gamma-glutamate synthesis protein (capsule biosynthesis protein)